MPTYKLAESAQHDIHDLLEYTISTWGKQQAEKYFDGFTKQAALLAEMPSLGRRYDKYKKAELRTFRYEKHVIYYVEATHGITILHVVHVSKDQISHLTRHQKISTGSL